MTNRPALTAALLVTLTALSACSSASDPEPRSASSATPTPSATVRPVAAITFDQPGGGDICLTTKGSRSVAVLDTAVKANTDLDITDVTLEKSTKVSLVTKDSVNLPPMNQGGTIAYGAIVDWPLTKETASNNVRWAARDELVGRTYAAGETGLPALHLVGKDGGSVGTVVFHYASAAEPAGEARYDLNLRFAKRC